MGTWLGPDQFIELQLDRGALQVLGVLDEEHHQEGHNRRPGVDHQLPGVAQAEGRASESPSHDDQDGEDEGQRMAHCAGGQGGKTSEECMMIHEASSIFGGSLTAVWVISLSCSTVVSHTLPARRKRLWCRLGNELADDLCP